MSHGTALWKGSTTAVGGLGELALAGDGTLTLAGVARLRLDLVTSPFLEVYATSLWMYGVGAADRQLVAGRADGPGLEVLAEIDRLDRGGRYDAATHAVRFHDRPDRDQCVLAWEIGLALLDPNAGLVWTVRHGDTGQRVVGITAATVELMGRDTAITVDLDHGTTSERPVGRRS